MNTVREPKKQKRIVELPYAAMSWNAAASVQSKPLDFDFYATELFVPSWVIGHNIIVEQFKIGPHQLVGELEGIPLEAFHKYKFTPRKALQHDRIVLRLLNQQASNVSVLLGVKGYELW